MPTVPRYGGPQVATTPLPGARVSTDAPRSAFMPPEPVDISPVVKLAEDIYAEERKKADEVVRLDWMAKLSQQRNELLYDQTRGALNRRGTDALDLPREVASEWRRRASNVRGTKPVTERQERIFQAMSANIFTDIDAVVARHTAAEMAAFEVERTESLIVAELGFALKDASDESRVSQSLETMRAAYRALARRNGKSQEWLQNQILTVTSNVRRAAIGQLFASGDNAAAAAYFEAHRDEFSPKDIGEVQEAVGEGLSDARSQEVADTIILKPGITRAAAFQEARAIQNPDVRRKVEARLDVEFSRRDAAEREAQSAALEAAAEFIERGQRPPASVRSRLTAGNRESIDDWWRKIAGGGTVRTDMTTYYGLLNAASNQATQQDFAVEDLLRYRNRLGNTEFKELARIQRSLREGKEDPEVRGTLSDEEIVRMEADRSKLFTGTSASAKIRLNTFRALVSRRLISEKESSGKTVLAEATVRRIVESAIDDTVFVDRRSGPKPVRIVDVRDDDRGRAFVPWDAITEDERSQVAQALRGLSGRIPSKGQVQRAYAAWQLDDQARFRAIAAEGR